VSDMEFSCAVPSSSHRGELYSRIAQSCARLTGRTSGLPENQRCTVGATVVRRGIVIVWVGLLSYDYSDAA